MHYSYVILRFSLVLYYPFVWRATSDSRRIGLAVVGSYLLVVRCTVLHTADCSERCAALRRCRVSTLASRRMSLT